MKEFRIIKRETLQVDGSYTEKFVIQQNNEYFDMWFSGWYDITRELNDYNEAFNTLQKLDPERFKRDTVVYPPSNKKS
jgi:hypothetical protein